MSPKEPDPIFRTSLYLPPTMNSALEPLLLAMARGGSRALPAGSAGQRGLNGRPRGGEKGLEEREGESGAAKDGPRAQLQPGPSGGRAAPPARLCAAPRLSARCGNRRSGPRGACESRKGKGGGLAGSRRPPAAHSAAAAILCLSRRRRHKMPPARGGRFFTARGALGAGRGAATQTTPPRRAAPITALPRRPALQAGAVIGRSAEVRMRTAPFRE